MTMKKLAKVISAILLLTILTVTTAKDVAKDNSTKEVAYSQHAGYPIYPPVG